MSVKAQNVQVINLISLNGKYKDISSVQEALRDEDYVTPLLNKLAFSLGAIKDPFKRIAYLKSQTDKMTCSELWWIQLALDDKGIMYDLQTRREWFELHHFEQAKNKEKNVQKKIDFLKKMGTCR